MDWKILVVKTDFPKVRHRMNAIPTNIFDYILKHSKLYMERQRNPVTYKERTHSIQ